MDFTPDLLSFQGSLISADNVYPLSKITTKGGNEEKIKYVIDKLYNILQDQGNVTNGHIKDDKVAHMRKLALFIALNADIPELEKMVDMEGIGLVIWAVPTISKTLMCEMFWHLHMEKFVYEIIAYTSPELAVVIAQAFLDSVKYFTPVESVSKVKLICSACYTFVCRLHCFHFDSSPNSLSKYLTDIFNTFHNALNYFTKPPNDTKLYVLVKDEQYKHKGNCLSAMLSLIDECLQHYTNKEPFFDPEISDQLYHLTYRDGSYTDTPQTFKICDSPSKPILEILNMFNELLLDKCKELVMDISLDIFCAWSEFEENGRSIQQSIGELAYNLRTKLLNVSPLSEHLVVSMLQQISRKPTDFNELFNEADSDTIIEKINKNNEEQILWLRALIRKEGLCHNKTLLEQLVLKCDIFDEAECNELYNTLNTGLKSSENKELIERLCVQVFKKCNNSAKLQILEERFSEGIFFNMIETVEFNNNMIEIFNKLIVSQESVFSDVLCMFLQNPEKMVTKMFHLAVENNQQSDIMFSVMKYLKKFSNHCYESDTEPLLIRVTNETLEDVLNTEVKEDNFINFLQNLKTESIISGVKLLLLIAMPNLHKGLLSKDINCMNVQIKLLSSIFTLEEMLQYRAPMLAMLAQVLDKVRWKIDTFEVISPFTLERTLLLQKLLFDSYKNQIPENEAKWLKSKMRNMQPTNQYYYRDLWSPSGRNFIEIVSGSRVHTGMNTEQLISWLTQVLCSSSRDEWNYVWDSLACFGDMMTMDIIHSAISLMALAEAANRTEASALCLLNCYRNFVFIIKHKFFKEPLTESQVVTVIQKINTIIHLMETHNMENEIEGLLLPLLAYVAEKKAGYNLDIQTTLRNKIKCLSFEAIASKVFTKETTG